MWVSSAGEKGIEGGMEVVRWAALPEVEDPIHLVDGLNYLGDEVEDAVNHKFYHPESSLCK